MHHVELICSSSGEHLSQIFSGFGLLAASGAVSVSLRTSADYHPGAAGHTLRAEVDGRPVVYDTGDLATFARDDLDWATAYFKRSFDAGAVAASGRPDIIRPLGLNYSVYCTGDWRFRRMTWSLLRLRGNNVRDVGTRIARLSSVGSRFTNMGRASSSLAHFEQDADQAGTAVLLLTRTWDPRQAEGNRAESYASLNRTRVESIRLLRDELGPRFIGGLSPTADALRNYPDLVVDASTVAKPAFLRTMKSAAVCIASRGLGESNGWRLAEYVAASRAIISEPLAHRVPGDFAPDRNYLEFSEPEDLVQTSLVLLEDDAKRSEMRSANHRYYTRYVRPDALIARTLEELESMT